MARKSLRVAHVNAQALRFYERLRQQPELSTPELWRKMAACQQALGNDEGAASIYSSILESELSP